MAYEPGFGLGPLGRVGVYVADLARAVAFYGEVLGLARLDVGDGWAVVDCGEVRLSIEESLEHSALRPASPLYFKVDDIQGARRELEARGVTFTDPIHKVAEFADHDLWITSFNDPDGHPLALMAEGPKGFVLG